MIIILTPIPVRPPPSPLPLENIPRLQENGSTLTSFFYNPVLREAAKVGDWGVAISAIDSMARSSLSDKSTGPDLSCFNYAISACTKAGKCEVTLLSSRIQVLGVKRYAQ